MIIYIINKFMSYINNKSIHEIHFNDIMLIIQKYIIKYQNIYHLPFYDSIINHKQKKDFYEFNKYIINKDNTLYNLIPSSNPLFPLISCYIYYNNYFNNNNYLHKSGKHTQIKGIIDIINHNNYNFDNIHELCCGKTFLGKEISTKFNKSLFGYDINQHLLDYNYIMMNKYNNNNNNNNNNKYKFIKKDLLNEEIIEKSENNEDKEEINKKSLITGLHCCGELHRNIIKSIVKNKFDGNFIIVPCCYDKHMSKSIKMNDIKYKFFNYDLEIPYQLLKSVVITPKGNSENKCQKYLYKRYLKIKSNLFYHYIISNNIINLDDYKHLDIYQYSENKYISIPDEFFADSDYKTEKIFWNTLFTNKNFMIENINYDNYKEIIDNLHEKTNSILNNISYEEYYLLEPLKKLLEFCIILDYAIYLTNNLNKFINIIPFVSSFNTPRNLALVS